MPRRKRPNKKPYPEFPLFLHQTNQWAKKIRGRLVYFGTDWREAKDLYDREKDDRYAGRIPRREGKRGVVSGSPSVADLVNEFLSAKRRQMDAGELTGQAWADLHRACARLVKTIKRERRADSLTPADFASARAAATKELGPAALAVYVVQVRMIFRHAAESKLIERPVDFGPEFKRPPKKLLRRMRREAGPKLITASAAWALMNAADPQLRCMIWLGLNCAFGQSDCSRLRRGDLVQRPGWIDNAREKTEVARRAPLWRETIDALKEVATMRPAPLDPANDGLVFITPKGHPWVYFADKGPHKPGARIDAVRARFDTVRAKAGVDVPGGFYTLRHTFRTIADEVKDQPAAMLIMGHSDETISDDYREQIGDDRVKAITDHVRSWLLAGRPVG